MSFIMQSFFSNIYQACVINKALFLVCDLWDMSFFKRRYIFKNNNYIKQKKSKNFFCNFLPYHWFFSIVLKIFLLKFLIQNWQWEMARFLCKLLRRGYLNCHKNLTTLYHSKDLRAPKLLLYFIRFQNDIVLSCFAHSTAVWPFRKLALPFFSFKSQGCLAHCEHSGNTWQMSGADWQQHFCEKCCTKKYTL